MKKLFLLCVLVSGLFSVRATSYTTSLTSGYVFKQGDRFKQVYGHGVVNVITYDNCYYPLEHLGVGVKLSYWRGTGHTTFLGMPTLFQQVPVTFYLRGMKELNCGSRIFGSLGGGATWVQEQSYLGKVSSGKGLGEIEVGWSRTFWRGMAVTAIFRYLFPPQPVHGSSYKVDVGGSDLRLGFEWAY